MSDVEITEQLELFPAVGDTVHYTVNVFGVDHERVMEVTNIGAYDDTEPTLPMAANITGCSATPGSSVIVWSLKGGKKQEFDLSKDPMRFIFDPGLNNCALLQDQMILGCSLSTHSYYSGQLEQYRKSIGWGLVNMCGLNWKQAKHYVNIAIDTFIRNIQTKYDVDLTAKIPYKDAMLDKELLEQQASRQFYESRSK